MLPYWFPYWGDMVDPENVSIGLKPAVYDEPQDLDEEVQDIMGEFDVLHLDSATNSVFGVAIRVSGENSYSDIRLWNGICFVLSSDALLSVKIGLSDEREEELDYNLPRIELIDAYAAGAGNVVINCKGWNEFTQDSTLGSATITGEEAAREMESLKFEFTPIGEGFGEFSISGILPYHGKRENVAGDPDE